MKKLLLLLFFTPFIVKGTVYTSVVNGDWITPATWGLGSGFPGFNDTAIINNTVTVVSTDPEEGCKYLVINSGGVLNNSQTFALEGKVRNNTGGKWQGSGAVGVVGKGSKDTVISGGGDFSKQTGIWYFQGSTPSTQTMIIAPSVNFVKTGGNFFLETSIEKAPLRILNFGTVNMSGTTLYSSGGYPTSWVQEANSGLWITAPPLTNAYDTLVASAAGNYVEYQAGSFTIKKPLGGIYYNLFLHTGTHTIPSGITVSHLFEPDAPSAVVNMNGQSITIGGNWMNYGTITNNTGTVTFNGSSTQTIGGSHNTRFANMTISGSGNVNLALSSGFTGVLTLSGSGNLTASAGLTDTLISTSGSTARVAQITGSGTITANFVVQRYDGRTTANYEALSSPVQSTTLGDWNTSNRNPKFYMSGVGGPDGNAGSYVSVYVYGETTNTYNQITSYSSPGINYVLPKGQGIYLWMGNSLTTMSPFTYITHGVPTSGNVTVNVTNTSGKGNGFNLIGNPYPSPISWSSLAGGNANLQNAYYLFEQDGSWHTFIGGSFIPMEQGFGVVTTSSGTVTFQESFKSSTDASLQRTVDPGEDENALTFTLSTDANHYSCPTIVSFGDNYSSDYDPAEDAIFIESFIKEVPQLYTSSQDNHTYSLNRLSDNSETVDVPLIAIGNVAGNYTLNCKNITSLTSYNCVLLIDSKTGAILNNFKDSPSYTFTVTNTEEPNNFILRFSTTSIAALDNQSNNVKVYANQSGVVLNFNLASSQNVLVSVYNVSGQKAIEDIHFNAYNNELTINQLRRGAIYLVRIETNSGTVVKKLYY